MCALFGIHDYSDYFNKKQKNIILSVLSAEAEVRGTDATGIAYNYKDNLRIFKRPIPAHRMWYLVPDNTKVVMGHTRMTTQGSEDKNYNNHPFYGTCGNTKFTFAHNGIIHNDEYLRKQYQLPETKIQTDSYIGVQILEKEKTLDFDSLAKMAETIRGSFTFTILDNTDNLHFIKGDNPLCIYHFVNRGFYIYASTTEIADKALRRLGLDKKKHEEIPSRCGDILKIDKTGNISTSRFDTSGIYSQYSGYFRPYSYSLFEEEEREYDDDYILVLKNIASSFGYRPEDIDTMLMEGYSLDEIEDFFYDGEKMLFIR